MNLKAEVQEWLETKVSDGYDEKTALIELQQNGCISGMVSELIYHDDTVKFFDRNLAEIVELISDWCEMSGSNFKEFILSGNNFPLEKKEIEHYHFVEGLTGLLKDFEDDEVQLKNWFAWFAFEETAYQVYCNKYE